MLRMFRNMLALSLDPDTPSVLTTTLEAAPLLSVSDGLRAAQALADLNAFPGEGRTPDLWSTLATVAAVDLGLARAMEPHLDAAAILHQAAEQGLLTVTHSGRTWGVFAAEGSGEPLRATRTTDTWTLTGTKPWCSLAATLDRALVSATLHDGERALFAVDLRAPGVEVLSGDWHARGLAEIPSGPVRFIGAEALPVGHAGW
jgi:alkylation response protein AidB-like acyl-CoA dehydrogenase